MDHTLYDYSALPLRPPEATGAALHAFAVLVLEHWELCAPPDALRDPRLVGEFGSFSPDYRSWTQREYGLRIGVFRVLDALRAAGIPLVVAANAMVVHRLPALMQQLQEAGCSWIAHGISATRIMHSGMREDEQSEMIEQSIEAIKQLTGQPPLGWLSQDWGNTPDTSRLLVHAGIRYTLDWCNDDQIYWHRTEPPLLAIPLSAEWDDVQCQWLRYLEPRAHGALALAAFERLRGECAMHQRNAVFGLPIHPWVSGMPSRVAAMRSLLTALRQHRDVQWSTPDTLFTNHIRNQSHGLS